MSNSSMRVSSMVRITKGGQKLVTPDLNILYDFNVSTFAIDLAETFGDTTTLNLVLYLANMSQTKPATVLFKNNETGVYIDLAELDPLKSESIVFDSNYLVSLYISGNVRLVTTGSLLENKSHTIL